MATLLVANYSNTSLGDKDRLCIKRGDILTVREDSGPFGGKEIPPRFFHIVVTDRSVGQIKSLKKDWSRILQLSVISSDLQNDEFVIKAESQYVRSTPLLGEDGKITLSAASSHLANWNMQVIDSGDNYIDFSVYVYDAIISNGFWDRDVSNIYFSELSYDPGTGIHRVSIDYHAYEDADEAVLAYIEKRGASIVSQDQQQNIIIADFTRGDVRDEFQDDLKDKLLRPCLARRYRISNDGMDYLDGQGGYASVTFAQASNYIEDKLDG